MKPVAPWRVLRHYLDHPLGRRDRIGTLVRMLRWQAGKPSARRSGGDAVRGWHPAAGAQRHARRHGEYLCRAHGVRGHGLRAALAMEPVPDTYQQLLDNVHLNRFGAIEARNLGVGKEPGELRFSTGSGPTNHVLADGEGDAQSVTVPVDSLDNIAAGWTPAMIKIDVEGFEANVIQGAPKILSQPSLQAVLIELNGLGARYGFSDADIHARLLGFGFHPMRYEPFARRLVALEGHNTSGNTLYVRPPAALEQRLREAQAVRVVGVSV